MGWGIMSRVVITSTGVRPLDEVVKEGLYICEEHCYVCGSTFLSTLSRAGSIVCPECRKNRVVRKRGG